jgi:hypothetical protein
VCQKNGSMQEPELDPRPRERGQRPDVANFGFIRPPFVYLAAILVGAGLDFLWPCVGCPPRSEYGLGFRW